jgi:hypothetical protein
VHSVNNPRGWSLNAPSHLQFIIATAEVSESVTRRSSEALWWQAIVYCWGEATEAPSLAKASATNGQR